MSTTSKDESQQAPLTFETALSRLQNTVKQLEGGELSLEDSLKTFEEGVRLTRFCQEQLASAEQKVELLLKDGDSVKTEEFNPSRPKRGN